MLVEVLEMAGIEHWTLRFLNGKERPNSSHPSHPTPFSILHHSWLESIVIVTATLTLDQTYIRLCLHPIAPFDCCKIKPSATSTAEAAAAACSLSDAFKLH